MTSVPLNTLETGIVFKKTFSSARPVLCFKKILQQTEGQQTNLAYSLEHGFEKLSTRDFDLD
jgi:hypothetical protein